MKELLLLGWQTPRLSRSLRTRVRSKMCKTLARAVLSEPDALDAPLNTVFRTAADANHWAWIDMNDYMCDESDCGIIREDVLMYRDNSHLTDTFSAELAPRFEPKVLALLDQ